MSPRTLQMLVTFLLFTVVMAGIGWVARLVVPPFIDWAGHTIGIGWVLGITACVIAVAGYAGYRGEMAARAGRSDRSDRSLTD